MIESIIGDGGRLSLDATKNCVGIAANAALKAMGRETTCGISLKLDKVQSPRLSLCPGASSHSHTGAAAITITRDTGV